MKNKICIIGLTVGFLIFITIPVFAEVQAGTSEFGIHIGGILGDGLTSLPVSGSHPELDSSVAWGVDYTYNIGFNWGIEGRYTIHISEAINSPTTSDLNVHIFDINAVYHFNPESKTVFYATAGVGVAIADLENDIRGIVNSQTENISDSDGLTFNAGGGLKYFATENVVLRADVRYRYIDRLVSQFEESLNTLEITAGMGYRF